MKKALVSETPACTKAWKDKNIKKTRQNIMLVTCLYNPKRVVIADFCNKSLLILLNREYINAENEQLIILNFDCVDHIFNFLKSTLYLLGIHANSTDVVWFSVIHLLSFITYSLF